MLLFIVIHYVVYMFFHLLEKTIHQTFPFTILCKSTAKKKKKIEQNPIFSSPETIGSIKSFPFIIKSRVRGRLYIQLWWNLTIGKMREDESHLKQNLLIIHEFCLH